MDTTGMDRRPNSVEEEVSSSVLLVKSRVRASIERIPWRLPPSKSHAIRWLALAAQSEQKVVIHNLSHAGQDILSMRRCLGQLGVRITDLNHLGEALSLIHI